MIRLCRLLPGWRHRGCRRSSVQAVMDCFALLAMTGYGFGFGSGAVAGAVAGSASVTFSVTARSVATWQSRGGAGLAAGTAAKGLSMSSGYTCGTDGTAGQPMDCFALLAMTGLGFSFGAVVAAGSGSASVTSSVTARSVATWQSSGGRAGVAAATAAYAMNCFALLAMTGLGFGFGAVAAAGSGSASVTSSVTARSVATWQSSGAVLALWRRPRRARWIASLCSQ